ncbi:MAG: macro domain-containing protein [Ardenticatenales bacterium]|nr:macro domain-containing protein [Ardenticatenales bacterium]
MDQLRLILVDPNYKMCAAWREVFDSFPNVEVVRGYFEELPEFDCMVSAANSFGLMDGGVDAAIIRFFGARLQVWVQTHILEEYLGEQPVGTSFIIETANPEHPFIAHTPTMRVPMEISRRDNVYLAMWAMLLAVRRHNRVSAERINIVACPGLGTGTGHVPVREAARQMSLAYTHFLNPPSQITWDLAHERQFGVLYGSDMDDRLPPLK